MSKNHGQIVLLILSTALGTACQAKLDVEVKKGAPLPSAGQANVPQLPSAMVDADLALRRIRKVYQSRQPIYVRLAPTFLGNATTISVRNVTDAAQDREDEAPAWLENQSVPALGSSQTSPGLPGMKMWRDQTGLDIRVPSISAQVKLDSGFQGALKYGKNRLKVVAADAGEERVTYLTLTIRDFDIMGPAMTSFADNPNEQVATMMGADGYQFQGWVNAVSPPLVATGEGTDQREITVGWGNVVN